MSSYLKDDEGEKRSFHRLDAVHEGASEGKKWFDIAEVIAKWDDVIAEKEKRSAIQNWWNHDDHRKEAGALDGFRQQFTDLAKKMSGAEFWQQLEAVFMFEAAVAEIPDTQKHYVEDLMTCIVEDFEYVLKPVPDEDDLRKFAQALVDMQNDKFGTDKELKKWAEDKRYHPKNFAKPPDDMVNGNLRQAVHKLQDDHKKIPILEWFTSCLLKQLGEDKYEQFDDHAFELMITMVEEKSQMKWSTIGWVVGALVKTGVVDHSDFVLGSRKRHQFMPLTVSVLPRASFQLTRLTAVLQGQEARIQSTKSKMLAIAMSVAISLSQIVAHYVNSLFLAEYLSKS